VGISSHWRIQCVRRDQSDVHALDNLTRVAVRCTICIQLLPSHWGTLMIQGKGGSTSLLYSKEGVMQGDPLSMLGYGIGILPLIRCLQTKIPTIKQPWYANNAGTGGSFSDLRKFFFGSKS
jgi:hypothetical protein